MKRIIFCALVAVMLFCGAGLWGQKQAYTWTFGAAAGIDFSTIPPTYFKSKLPGRSYFSIYEGVASIADTAANLKLYTDGIRLYRVSPGTDFRNIANHSLVSSSLRGSSSAAQSGLMIPHPGKKEVYYIFSLTASGAVGGGLYYSTYDYGRDVLGPGSLGAGMGYQNRHLLRSVLSVSFPSFSYEHALECLTAVRRTDKEGFWVIAFRYFDNGGGLHTLSTYVYGVDINGLDETPVVSDIYKNIDIVTRPDLAFGTGVFFDGNAVAYAKASPSGKRLAVAFTSRHALLNLDFDPSTGRASSPQVLQNNTITTGRFLVNRPYGLEFSRTGRYLYASERRLRWRPAPGRPTWSPEENHIYRYDVSLGTAAAVRASQTQIGSIDPSTFSSESGISIQFGKFELGGLQLGPDGKIYVAQENLPRFYDPLSTSYASDRPVVARGGYDTTRVPRNYLGVIDYPDVPARTRYRWRGIPLEKPGGDGTG